MLFRLCLMASLLIPAFASAEIGPATNPDETASATHFDTLAEWFRNGEVITLSDVPRSRPGRCFETWTANSPTNSLLFRAQRPKNADLGPGLGDQVEVAIAALFRFNEHGRALPPSALDNVSASELNEAQRVVWDLVRRGIVKLPEHSDNSVIWISDFEPNGRLDLRHTLVSSGDYLVLEIYNLIPNNVIAGLADNIRRRNIPVGPVTYCYFFEPTGAN